MITVGPNCESAVSRMLGLLGLEHIWFRVKRRVVSRGKLTHKIAPLFPGYIFVMARDMWSAVERIVHVRGFVRFGGIIQTVPDAILAQLSARADRDGLLNESDLPYKLGQAISVNVGGQQTLGKFREFLTPMRCLVDVPMLGRICSVRVKLGDLKPA